MGMGKTWYHVAPASARAEISELGLLPSRPCDDPWDEPGITDEQFEGVYLWDRLEVALDFATSQSNPHDVYQVLQAFEVSQDPLLDDAWMTPESIPPEDLLLLPQSL